MFPRKLVPEKATNVAGQLHLKDNRVNVFKVVYSPEMTAVFLSF